MAKTCFQCRGLGFNPWSGNQIPHAATKSSHITARDMKLLSILEAKRKVKEEGRVVPTRLFQLFPFSITAADGSYGHGLNARSPPKCHVLSPV